MNQANQIYQYMMIHGSITAAEAVREIGCYRLAARISDLREDGHMIRSDMEIVNSRDGRPVKIARYSIDPAERAYILNARKSIEEAGQ